MHHLIARKVLASLSLLTLATAFVGACQDSPRIIVGQSDVDGSARDGGRTPSDGGPIVVFPDARPVPDAPVCTGGDCVPDGGGGDVRPAAICGNAQVEEGETCDDGNSRPGDGCSGLCRTEPFFECKTAGMPCASTLRCGDGMVMGNEACDDGNATAGDGCSASCNVEVGYACTTPGQVCTMVPTAKCGDGVVNAGETCDDGALLDGDGCSTMCKLEAGYSCPMPGKACVKDEYCGDAKLNGAEQCDDGNIAPGDGCSGLCRTEQYFECKMPGKPCTTTIVCGDGKVIGDEACDDGNTTAGDGCAANCKSVEPGFSCPTTAGVGGACTMRPMDSCGDGRLSFGEFCDDGNMANGDGCTNMCRVEPGYTCPTAGMACKLVEWCGNGKLSVADGEECDDSNMTGGDGCSATCKVEANFVCPAPGMPCQSTVKCGDRKITGAETCDDGNLAAADGCGPNCQIENGWTCPSGGVCRPTRCGDSIKVGPEGCDDGNATAGDGCSATCQVETPGPTEGNGWVCPTVGQPCVRTTCGNAMQEGSEQCDDGNNDTGDGCSPFCRKEPVCPAAGGACSTSCGDGLLLPVDVAGGQECDDGNTNSGDGCSSTCKIERGYQCTSTPIASDSLILPIIIRDFRGRAETNGHGDFEGPFMNPGDPGITENLLGPSGKPVHVAGRKDHTVNGDPQYNDRDYFALWYKDDAAFNRTIRQTLTFTRLPTGEYQYTNGQFYPVNGQGWGNYGSTGRNYHFTTEVRYWFEYKGNEKLDFTGDDDLWVFINKRLAVDLGGIHPERNASLTLHATNGTASVCDFVARGINNLTCSTNRTVDLGLQVGNVYEIVVFHAERHTVDSNYKLTLSNFSGTRSVCQTVCGDAIVAGTEACDLGTAGNTGAYGTCNANCTLPPRCGDAVVQQANEQCDDGTNLSTYGGTMQRCAPGCVWAPRCGDGKTDGANNEACDQGADNGKGYGFCSTTCQLGPRCGDGVVTNSEQCDDGIMGNGTEKSACTAMCTKKCGNGTLDGGEQCDNGAANNTGGYGKCDAMCLLGPRCGDGIKNGAETCDDGKNDGSYGACTNTCTLGPRCGDGAVQTTAGEVCDLGAMNEANPYGMNKCTARCRPAPYCGDKAVDAAQGEMCDDGVNSGQPGSCKVDCSGAVPLPSCGDGTVQAPAEQCDDGAGNGTATSTCDGRCKKKCGNGVKDTGEECDDGKNDGSYGTCTAECKLAPYCGDGAKNGPEGCDKGAMNEANPYGKDKCTTTCAVAPFCGDGRIQTTFGETCDGTPGCSDMCKPKLIE